MLIGEITRDLGIEIRKLFTHMNRNGVWLTVLVVFSGLMRLLTINKELTNLLYCDEAIYQNEIERMLSQDTFVTKVFLAGGVNFFPLIYILKLF